MAGFFLPRKSIWVLYRVQRIVCVVQFLDVFNDEREYVFRSVFLSNCISTKLFFAVLDTEEASIVKLQSLVRRKNTGH